MQTHFSGLVRWGDYAKHKYCIFNNQWIQQPVPQLGRRGWQCKNNQDSPVCADLSMGAKENGIYCKEWKYKKNHFQNFFRKVTKLYISIYKVSNGYSNEYHGWGEENNT